MAVKSGVPFALELAALGLKGMVGMQIASVRQTLKLIKAIYPPVWFAELAEAPWQQTWWFQVLDFMHRLADMVDVTCNKPMPAFDHLDQIVNESHFHSSVCHVFQLQP